VRRAGSTAASVADEASIEKSKGDLVRRALEDERAPERVDAREVFARGAFGQHECEGLLERRCRVAGTPFEIEELEERTVGVREALLRVGLVVRAGHRDAVRDLETGRALDLREVLLEERCRGPGDRGERNGGCDSSAEKVARDAMNAVCFREVLVVAELVLDEERDQQKAGEADRKPDDIDRRVELVRDQVLDGNRDVASQHSGSPRGAGSGSPYS
jgi:hypothetical protein